MTVKEKLEYLKENKDAIYIIHYSCENLNDNNEGYSPRITSLAIIHVESDTTHSFSIHLVAEQMKIDRSEIKNRYDDIEKVMLEEFNDFIKNHQEGLWIHWNMSNINYGFQAIEHRYKVLTGKEASKVSDLKKFNLSKMILGIYGKDCVEHPRMPNFMKLNGGTHRDYLSGEEEVKAFENQEYFKLHKSTIGKTNWFEMMYKKLQNRKIKTSKTNLPNKISSFLEHPYTKLLGFIAVLFALYKIGATVYEKNYTQSVIKEDTYKSVEKHNKYLERNK